MEFQFNFFTDTAAGNDTEAAVNEKQGCIQGPLVIADPQENSEERKSKVSSEKSILNHNTSSQIASCETSYITFSKTDGIILPEKDFCPKYAKEHNVPQDSSKLLENKVLSTLPNRYYADISVVEMPLSRNSLEEDEVSKAFSSHSDLISGVYEGGFKIWECTFDLMDYLSEAKIQFTHKQVLDLGCGAGLLGIVALKGNAGKVHFQDYNSTVIEEVTLPNVLINCVHQDEAGGISELSSQLCKADLSQTSFSKCKFFSGEWSGFSKLLLNSNKPLTKYDIILTSETIYNPDYYEVLHDTFSKLLDKNGCVYLASKAHYFGCGGGIFLFTKFIEEKNMFKSRTVKVINQGLKRFIIELVFKQSC